MKDRTEWLRDFFLQLSGTEAGSGSRTVGDLENSIWYDLVGKKRQRVITMQSKRTFIAAISVMMLRLTMFLEIMKALNEEMTI